MKPRPILKWAGGKTQLLPQILPLLPKKCNTYFEPFVGGGAVFLAMAQEGRFERAVISDTNNDLVAVYSVVKQNPALLIAELDKLNDFSESAYYQIREKSGRGHVFECAARTIYLNRVGFNGLYRVNRDGKFNSPYGHRKSVKLYDRDNIMLWHKHLQKATLHTGGFELSTWAASRGDAAYIDPPYLPVSKTSNFTAYSPDGFSIVEHAKLAAAVTWLKKRGVSVVLSQGPHPVVDALFADFNRHEVTARRAINSKASKRGRVKELIFTTERTSP